MWLDDLDRYIGEADDFRPQWLSQFRQAGNLVVATIRESAYEQFQPAGGLRPPQWDVLTGFQRVRLRDSEAERRRLAVEVADPGGCATRM